MGRWIALAYLPFIVLTSCFSPLAYDTSCTGTCDAPPIYLRDAKPKKRIAVFVGISGGGIRASAFSYGVLDELRLKYPIIFNSISHISGVSGGAFTAAYLVSNPPEDFPKFETFLNNDHELPLLLKVIANINILDPISSIRRRSALAAKYYDRVLFNQFTFGKLKTERPFLIINASDLVTGRRFTFTQEQFHCLGLDLSKFKLAEAVAASSAFPVAFSTIVLENKHSVPTDCFSPAELTSLQLSAPGNPDTTNPQQDTTLSSATEDLIHRMRYLDRTRTAYLHLSDGGLTDNLGLESVKDILLPLEQMIRDDEIDGLVVISINSATPLNNSFGSSDSNPSFIDIISTQSDFALKTMGKFSESSVETTLNNLQQTVRNTKKKHFIAVCMKFSFFDMLQENLRSVLYNVPTRLALENNDVATLMNAGRFFVDVNSERLINIEELLKDPKGIANHNDLSCSFAKQLQEISQNATSDGRN